MLDIAGVNVGFLKKFSGFAMEADIVSYDDAAANVQKKRVASIKWTPAKATIGIGMGKEMYQWIKAAFDKGYETRDGGLVSADFNYKAQSRFNFQSAHITSVTIPKLDGSSKDAAYFEVEFEAEQVRWEKGGGENVKAKAGAKQKAWLCSNFRVEIGSLPCRRVATVDSFTWKCAVAADQVGDFREPTKHPAKVTVPDIKLGVAMADYQPWAEAAKKWFVDGLHEEKDTMTGRIAFLNPDMKTEIGSIELLNIGFKKFFPNDLEANTGKIARFDVELYCEAMKFNIKDYVGARK